MLKVYKDYQSLIQKLRDYCQGLGYEFDELEIIDQEKEIFHVTLKTYPSKYVRADIEILEINIENIS